MTTPLSVPSSHPPVVPNRQLVAARIPDPSSPWPVIARFALTFPGYELLGDRCGDIANARRHGTLTELRACLFFEQRRWRHFGMCPEGEELAYMQDLVRQIRQRVELAERLLA